MLEANDIGLIRLLFCDCGLFLTSPACKYSEVQSFDQLSPVPTKGSKPPHSCEVGPDSWTATAGRGGARATGQSPGGLALTAAARGGSRVPPEQHGLRNLGWGPSNSNQLCASPPLVSLCLGFLTCKMEIMRAPALQSSREMT